MKNPLFEQSHPSTKLLFLLFIIVASFSIFLILGLITAVPFFGIQLSSFQDALNINNPDNIGLIKYMQFIQHMGIFVVPPLVAAYVFSKYPISYLSADTKSKFAVYLLATVIIIFAIPFINYTGALNAKMSLPAGFEGFEEKIKAMEESAGKMTEAFLNVKSIGGLFVNLIIVALLPAIGEEFLFRGVLLRLFKEWTKNKHAAILISAFLFSAVHFQFYGFLPRFLLGALFGYLFVWSRNIWVPVTVHFINNGLAVLLYYFMHDTELYEKADTLGTDSLTMPSVFFSVLIGGIFLYFFYKLTKTEISTVDSQQEQ
ncbi:MAG: CPBP family intramembrane metalloprotease [Bacteroidales bacterium]|nr:CPBP family intramembrane metalloprotease [Bacteroidales bacterium]